MCAIFAIFGLACRACQFRKKAIEASKKQRHRGPDATRVWSDDHNILIQERLAVVDLTDRALQPFFSANQRYVSLTNGEIYNHEELEAKLPDDVRSAFISDSDCEIIAHMREVYGEDFMTSQVVNGMFAFVVYDRETGEYMAARDHVGIIPLYMGWAADGSVWFASEMKCLVDHCVNYQCFPPGHVYRSRTQTFEPFYKPQWHNDKFVPSTPCQLAELREALTASVRSHLMCDAPLGVLLSGGLDSSLTASIAQKLLRNERGRTSPLYSFCIGLEGSPDLAAAQKVADFIGTKHFGFKYTIEEGIDALSEVIYHLETFDVTTIRASTPMFLMARKIKAMGIKMVLSGEGADEVMAGYLYFHSAPSREALHEESIRKVKKLYLYDNLRCNKSMMAWGIEPRVPFLDRQFLEYAMGMDPWDKISGLRNRMEKFIVRSAFDVVDPADGKPYLPKEVLWRQKEQFSDGVGYGWIDSLKDLAEETVSDEQMKFAAQRFPGKPPKTKEAYMYREMFDEHFPSRSASDTVPYEDSVACSTPIALEWDEAFKNMADPSGRAVGVHSSSYYNLEEATTVTDTSFMSVSDGSPQPLGS